MQLDEVTLHLQPDPPAENKKKMLGFQKCKNWRQFCLALNVSKWSIEKRQAEQGTGPSIGNLPSYQQGGSL